MKMYAAPPSPSCRGSRGGPSQTQGRHALREEETKWIKMNIMERSGMLALSALDWPRLLNFLLRPYEFKGDFWGDRMKCPPKEKAAVERWLTAPRPPRLRSGRRGPGSGRTCKCQFGRRPVRQPRAVGVRSVPYGTGADWWPRMSSVDGSGFIPRAEEEAGGRALSWVGVFTVALAAGETSPKGGQGLLHGEHARCVD